MPEFVRKVSGLIIRKDDVGYSLLVHGFEHDRSLPLRFPGGGIDDRETEIDALLREIHEESGITQLEVIRKLGVTRYFKPYSRKYVERHDYLLQASTTADHWTHQVKGSGDDAGEIFVYQWLKQPEFYRIDVELQKFLDQLHIPELFTAIDEHL